MTYHEERTVFRVGPVHRLWLRLELLATRITSAELNPLYYLGAIGIFFLLVILVTGIYLFFFYNITAEGAYPSVQWLTEEQWWLGGIMRSAHRYASQGLVVVMVLHVARCLVTGRYRHWRWVAWVTGVGAAWIVVIGGIFGYWLVWDETAQLAASLASAMIEAVPIFGLPLRLNFARPENLTDQLFYIVFFIHFGTIVFLFILLWVHLSRITKAVINPPKAMAYALVAVLLLLSLVKPAVSEGPARLDVLPGEVYFDWFFFFVFPALKYVSEHTLWIGIIAATLAAGAVPWMGRGRRRRAVEVSYEDCTGCELCMEDCPYVAIKIRPRTDNRPYDLEAVVTPQRCASCGICVGSCDYRAINLPDLTEFDVKDRIRGLCGELGGAEGSVLVFHCARSASLDGIADGSGRIEGRPAVRVVVLPCIGMLQPSMITIPFEAGVDGVLIVGCRPMDCHFRRGNEWVAARLAGTRPPVVRRTVDRTRLRLLWLSAVETGEFLAELDRFGAAMKERTR